MRRKRWIRVYSLNAFRMKSPNAVKRLYPFKKQRKTTGNAIPIVSKPSKRKRMNLSANWTN